MCNLIESQKNLLRWMVKEVREGRLKEEFCVHWAMGRPLIGEYRDRSRIPTFTRLTLDALADEGFLRCHENKVGIASRHVCEVSYTTCVLTAKAHEAVDSDFNAPDTSFLKHLTPLADVTNFDEQLKRRCLPILGAGAADPELWDSAVRTAGAILEERLRDVGGIADRNRVGQALVNDVFSERGTLASKFQVDSERQGYRDQFAGVVGTLRNPSAHRLLDPSPETGGAILVFINYLLKKLEELR